MSVWQLLQELQKKKSSSRKVAWRRLNPRRSSGWISRLRRRRSDCAHLRETGSVRTPHPHERRSCSSVWGRPRGRISERWAEPPLRRITNYERLLRRAAVTARRPLTHPGAWCHPARKHAIQVAGLRRPPVGPSFTVSGALLFFKTAPKWWPTCCVQGWRLNLRF